MDIESGYVLSEEGSYGQKPFLILFGTPRCLVDYKAEVLLDPGDSVRMRLGKVVIPAPSQLRSNSPGTPSGSHVY